MLVKIAKLSRTEFELEDGRTFPIIPPLERDMTVEEFQKHYDRARELIGSLEPAESQSEDAEAVGRGLGMLERKDFKVTLNPKKNGHLNLEGRQCTIASTVKAYSWMEESFLYPKQSTLTASSLAVGSRPTIDDSMGEIPMGESSTITGRGSVILNNQ